MAENITETNVQTEQEVPDASQELAQHMAIALNNGIIPQPVKKEETPPAEVVQDTPPPPQFSFDTFREKFAYEKPEDAIKEIEELRAFRQNPVAEIEFENEQSKKLFEAIQAGKQKEAYAILAEQDRLDSLTSIEINKDNAAEIIKQGLQYKYPNLSKSDIDYKFKKQFSYPKEPVWNETIETEDEFKNRHFEWKDQVRDIEMDKVLEAKLLIPELESRKQKLVLPDIEADIDENYQKWLESQDNISKVLAEASEAYKIFTPKSIETKINFNDEANKIAFEFEYVPDSESFEKARSMGQNIQLFWNEFVNQDGSPNRQKFLDAMYFALNKEKVLTEAMKQAKNATIKAMIPNNNGAIIKQLPQRQEGSELDAYMRAAGILK